MLLPFFLALWQRPFSSVNLTKNAPKCQAHLHRVLHCTHHSGWKRWMRIINVTESPITWEVLPQHQHCAGCLIGGSVRCSTMLSLLLLLLLLLLLWLLKVLTALRCDH